MKLTLITIIALEITSQNIKNIVSKSVVPLLSVCTVDTDRCPHPIGKVITDLLIYTQSHLQIKGEIHNTDLHPATNFPYLDS